MLKKSIVGEGQMQINYDSVEPVPTEIIPVEAEQESSLDKLFRAHGITEKEFDDYADRRGCSAYEAYRNFGISMNEVDNMSTLYPVGEVEVISEDEEDVEKVVGPSVLIAKRALRLTSALANYSKASKASGFRQALDTPHAKDLYKRYDENGLARIIGSQGTSKASGDAEFLKAYGAEEMIAAGEKPSDIGYNGQVEANRFIGRYIGAKNESARGKYRRVLAKQEKRFK